jgi:DNA-binding transcriptional LysR family regulator
MRRGHPLAERPLTLDAYCGAKHLLASATGRAMGYVDRTLTSLGRTRRVVLTVNQYFTAGRVLTRSDLLTVLPRVFVPATGHEAQLLVRELPFDMGPMQVTMMWHLRRDAEPAQQWLRALVQQVAAAALAA